MNTNETNESQEFTLEDIMREFGTSAGELPKEAADAASPEISEEAPAEAAPEETSGMPEFTGEVIQAEDSVSEEEAPAQAPAEEVILSDTASVQIEVESGEQVQTTQDTIRLDDLAEVIAVATEANRISAAKDLEIAGEAVADTMDETIVLADLSEIVADQPQEDTDSAVTADTVKIGDLNQLGEDSEEEPAAPEQVYELPEDQLPPPPIVFTPRSRLRELKKKLVAGPEKRYYDLTEIGLGRVQAAIFLSLLIVVLCAGATTLYAMDMVMASRLRLMIFSQVLAMMVSALLGCYVLLDGIVDLFRGRFSLNTMLLITLIACSVDAYFCLRELRVPCCAAFSLEMTMALWNRSLRRQTEMHQMDTLRKAVRLDSLVKTPDYLDGKPGILRGDGEVEDFMDVYEAPSSPERVQSFYAIISLLVCTGIAVLAGMRHGASMAVQILSTSLLVAIPASFFVAMSRPAAILQKRLRMVGTVICGWKGVKGLCGKAVFPLREQDIFPQGSTKLNGVKFYGEREPEETISYACALAKAAENGLSPVFAQLLRSRNGIDYDPVNFRYYPNGGIGGEVNGEPVLLGTQQFLQDMGVEIPDGTMVNQAVYCSIDGTFSAVFAITYNRMKSSAGGLVTICGYRKLRPVLLSKDFMITEAFLKSKFGIKTKRFTFPTLEERENLAAIQADPEAPALALTTQDSLAASAYAVTGARALRTASKAGLIIHMIGGIMGMLIMLALAYLGSVELLTPVNVLLYQLVWMAPGLLITEWTRTV